MTLTECNHIITEICLVLQNMPETEILTLPEKKVLLPVLFQARMKNETIED
jgi:hypothetical protein